MRRTRSRDPAILRWRPLHIETIRLAISVAKRSKMIRSRLRSQITVSDQYQKTVSPSKPPHRLQTADNDGRY
ncbi:MAG: hypothetical protein R3D88_00030 [Alphaproteobacteria bacterium]